MTLLNTIILLGAIQGFICSGILLFSKTKKANKLSDRLLAALIFLLSLACFNIYLMLSGLPDKYPFIQTLGYFLPLTIAMPIGPLIYYYSKSLLNPGLSVNKFHFASVAIDLIPYSIGFVFVIRDYIGIEDGNSLIVAMDAAHTYVDIPRWLSTTAYLVIAMHGFFIKDKKPNKPKYISAFLIVFAAFQTIWFLHLIPYLIPATQEVLMSIVGWYPPYVPLAGLIYWLGFYGIAFQREGLGARALSIDDDRVSEVIERLRSAMESDKLFLNPELTLNDVVAKTRIPQKQISGVLNQHVNQSFNEFVNHYRVDEVKRRLAEGADDHLTISGLALECGFNSNATFQRAFKQITGMTPGNYKQTLKAAAPQVP
jgi:AraC-like DNA-binding protein